MLDLIIRNAKELNQAPVEIGIQDGKISQVAEKILEEAKREIFLGENQYLSAGWIDDHVHCYEKMNLYYDYPDEIGVSKG